MSSRQTASRALQRVLGALPHVEPGELDDVSRALTRRLRAARMQELGVDLEEKGGTDGR